MTGMAQGNAMAEIALALAMAFFALMVLTLISMGSGAAPAAGVSLPAGVPLRTTGDGPQDLPDGEAVPPENLVIYYGKRFFDAALQPIDPARTPARSDAATVLALAPDVSLSEALTASQTLGRSNATVTTLDDAWLRRLREQGR